MIGHVCSHCYSILTQFASIETENRFCWSRVSETGRQSVNFELFLVLGETWNSRARVGQLKCSGVASNAYTRWHSCRHDMTRQSHFLRHCSEWFPAAWKWLPTCRSTSKCTRDRAAAAEFLGSSSFLKSVKQLRLSMLFMFLAVVTFDFPIPLVAVSSSTSADPPALQMGSNSSSLVHGRFLQTSKRRGWAPLSKSQ